MMDVEALAAVERAARGATAGGPDAVARAAAAAEQAAISDGSPDRRRRLEAAVDGIVDAVAAEAFVLMPDRLACAQRHLLWSARARERGSRLLWEADIAAPPRYVDAEGIPRPLHDAEREGCPEARRKWRWLPNDLHGHWLDEAQVWQRLKHLFRLAEIQRRLSGPPTRADYDVLASIRKHADGLVAALNLLGGSSKRGERLRERALVSVLYRLPGPNAPTPVLACAGGRRDDAAQVSGADLAARQAKLDEGRHFVEELAAAAKLGVIGSPSEKRPPQDASLTLLLGTVEIFEIYTGRKATFNAMPRPSEFIRFAQAAHVRFGLPKPGGQGLVQAWQRLEEKPRPNRELARKEWRVGQQRAARWFRWLGRDTLK